MTKIILIKRCWECPFRFLPHSDSGAICQKSKQGIPFDENIPTWCKLKDILATRKTKSV